MAMLAGARPAGLHVQERPAVRVRDQAGVPAVLALVNGPAMVGPAVVAVPDSVEAHMARATASTRLQMARHATPRR
jgi:hypothetical protein